MLADCFWTAFIRHYHPGLQGHHKWKTDVKELTVGEVVLIVNPQLPRVLWLVSTVMETLAGADGRVRIARVMVKENTYTRPTVRLIPLPHLDDDDTDTSVRLS